MVVLKREMSSNECRFYMSEAGRVRHAPEAGRLTSEHSLTDSLWRANKGSAVFASWAAGAVFDLLSFEPTSCTRGRPCSVWNDERQELQRFAEGRTYLRTARAC